MHEWQEELETLDARIARDRARRVILRSALRALQSRTVAGRAFRLLERLGEAGPVPLGVLANALNLDSKLLHQVLRRNPLLFQPTKVGWRARPGGHA